MSGLSTPQRPPPGGAPGWRRCSSPHLRYPPSRLAIRAPHSAIWSLFNVDRPLAHLKTSRQSVTTIRRAGQGSYTSHASEVSPWRVAVWRPLPGSCSRCACCASQRPAVPSRPPAQARGRDSAPSRAGRSRPPRHRPPQRRNRRHAGGRRRSDGVVGSRGHGQPDPRRPRRSRQAGQALSSSTTRSSSTTSTSSMPRSPARSRITAPPIRSICRRSSRRRTCRKRAPSSQQAKQTYERAKELQQRQLVAQADARRRRGDAAGEAGRLRRGAAEREEPARRHRRVRRDA